MPHVRFLGASLLALAAATPALAPSQAWAQAQTDPAALQATQLDEIIVTATKREQTLQDVPISVAVTGQEVIERAQIRDLIDLQTVVPSLRVNQLNTVGQTNFIIRGFGNGAGNDGIESSVGVFIDGVYRSRSAGAMDDLPEIERIEVLRGPQSTLFGKNVSAGAISIITRQPDFDFGGRAEVSVGNYGLTQYRATVTGALSETVAARLSGSVNQRDGYATNIVTGSDVNDRDRWSLRGDVLWLPSDALTVRVIADYNAINEVCCGVQQIFNGPATQFIGAPAPFGLGAAISDPARLFDREVAFDTDPVNELRGRGLSAQADWRLGFADLTSITAYRTQTKASAEDVDFTGADLASRQDSNDIRTFTQELRLASDSDGPFHWLAGGFYQRERLDTAHEIRFGSEMRRYADTLSGTVPAALLGALPPPLQSALSGRSNIYALELLQSLVTPSIVPGSTYFQPGHGYYDEYRVDQTFYSLFGQADYEVTDRLTLTVGAAYMNDRKEASANVVMTEPFSALNLQNVPQFPALGLPADLYGALGGLQFFYGDTPNHGPVNYPSATESGVLAGDHLTYSLRAAYDFGVVNAYASYTTGWKAGAVNLSTDSRPPDVNGVGRTAAPEEVTVYELGVKTRFPGGFVNLALFEQSIEGFQSNAYTGTGYSLVNAGEQRTRGFEIDGAYSPVPWLSLTGAATYLDPTYESFTRAPCVSYDTVRCPRNAAGLMPPFRDLTGDRPPNMPEWAVSVAATFSHEFGDNVGAFLRAEYDYASDAHVVDTTPPELATWGQSNLNASLGFNLRDQGVEILFWGRNLTDHGTVISTFPTVAQDGSYSGYTNAPRTYGVTLRKSF